MLIQDLTIFKDDDVTPLLGTVDGSGNVVVASFSTDPAHPRSHLKFAENVGESEVRFWDGDSTLGQLTIEVIDLPTKAGDQDSGLVTSLLAAAAGIGLGNTQLLGRRFLVRQSEDSGITWDTVIDGTPTDVQMTDKIASYRIALRDIRERERRVRAFVKADSTVIFPWIGPKNGFGTITKWTAAGVYAGTAKLVPAVPGAYGKVLADPFGGWLFYPDYANDAVADAVLLASAAKNKEAWDEFTIPTPTGNSLTSSVPTSDGFSSMVLTYLEYEFRGFTAEWSADGVTWITCPITKATGQDARVDGSAIIYDMFEGQPRAKVLRFDTTGVTAPTAGQMVYLRYISNKAPTEDVPYYLDEPSYGHALEKAYTGVFSDPQVPPNVRFDGAQVDVMKTKTPPCLGIITEVKDDLRAWLAESIYKITGWAPTLRNGKVFPIQYTLPDSTVPLLTFTNANTRVGASWGHGTGLMVNRVTGKYKQVFVPSKVDPDQSLIVQDVDFSDESNFAATLLGTKDLKFEPDTACSVLPQTDNMTVSGDTALNIGYALMKQRAFDAIDRFSMGAQEIVLTGFTSDAAVKAAKEGDWCVIALTWLPDYQTGRRGMSRLGQITKINKERAAWREFTIIDAGPHNQPVGIPTVGNLRTNLNGSVSVDVTALPTQGGVVPEVEVQFAVSDASPTTDGQWELGELVSATGTVTSRAFPSSAKVWARFRGSAEGRRRSVWTILGPVTISRAAMIVDVSVEVIDGVPRVKWIPLETTLGVRIRYQRHAMGTIQPADPLTQVLDVAAGAANVGQYVDLPITLSQFEQVSVRVQAWSAFAAGAVSGTMGQMSQKLTGRRADFDVVLPLLLAEPSEDGQVGTLKLTPVDPQSRIVKVETAVAYGNDPILAGDWALTAPVGGVYTATIALREKQPGKIAWRLTGLVGDGTQAIVQEDAMAFALGSKPMRPQAKYWVAADGTLTVEARGDSDTTVMHVVVKLDAQPTTAEIDAAVSSPNAFTGRQATYTHPTKLAPRSRYFFGVRAYNTALPGSLDAQGSEVEGQSDQFVTPTNPGATVQVGSVGKDSRYLSLNGITLGLLATHVDVWVREARTDLGAATDVSNIGYRPANTPLRAGAGSLVLPVANPSNYVYVTLKAIDALNAVGEGTQAWDGVTGAPPVAGILNLKLQALSAPAAAPAPPSALSVVANGSGADLSITMPVSNLPPTLRIYRDGVPLIDIARTAGAAGVQAYTDAGRTPGATYSYQVYGVSAAGVLSLTGSPIASVTFGVTQIPKPTLAASAYSDAQGGFSITITPGVGTPAGVTWQLEHQTSTGYGIEGPGGVTYPNPYTNAEPSSATSFVHQHAPVDLSYHVERLRVTGRKTGYTDSLVSDVVTTTLPPLVMGGG